MIDSKEVLKDFKGSSPIFPLPNFVMFPKTTYSFNIFEERYKKLISDSLDKDRLFCSTLLKDHSDKDNHHSPDFHSIGTLCYIIEHKELDNGNFTIIASGLKKVIIKGKIYK